MRKRLHVGDLAPDVTEIELIALFEQAGPVDSVLLPLAANGAHSGYALIQMETADGATDAVRRFNGFEFHGRRLFVYSVPPRSTPKRV